TATHLLNHALRKVVGEESDQRGSLVAPDRLRFDFAASGVVAADKLAEVDKLVTEAIERDMRVHAAPAPLGAAQSVNGLRAVFGERYPDPVRVVAIGPSVEDLLAEPDADRWPEFSIEFCGGTHLSSTGEAKAFCVISEEAVAKGIRRVTALTGHAAVAAQRAAEHLDWSLEEASKHEGARLKSELAGILVALDEMTVPAARAATIRAGVKKLQEKLKSYEKEIAKQAAVEAQKAAAGLAEEAAASGDPFYVSAIHAGSDRGALQAALGVITAGSPSKAVMLLSPDEAAGRAAVAAAVPKDLTAKLKAGDWVREVAGVMGGKGGGKPDSAQGSGADLSKLDDALAAAARFAAEKLG
ncbi:MAG: DHHA1 domain-containing protein, partial [Planctomycetota bacterium]